MYRLTEIAAIALVFGIALVIAPQLAVPLLAGIGIVYVALIAASMRAFHRAVTSGHVKHDATGRAWFIRPTCPRRWLVKRHIRATFS